MVSRGPRIWTSGREFFMASAGCVMQGKVIILNDNYLMLV
jgi:hypothetical protein